MRPWNPLIHFHKASHYLLHRIVLNKKKKSEAAEEIFMTISAQPFYLWTLINTESWKMGNILCSLCLIRITMNLRTDNYSFWVTNWIIKFTAVEMNGRSFVRSFLAKTCHTKHLFLMGKLWNTWIFTALDMMNFLFQIKNTNQIICKCEREC